MFLSWEAGRETRPTVAPLWPGKTVALPKIRVYLRPFAVALALPRNILSINAIHPIIWSHGENLTISAQNRKTYGRLLGTISSEGSLSLVITAMQRLAAEAMSGNRKNTKKNVILFRVEGPFSAETARNWPIFCVSTKPSCAYRLLRHWHIGNCVNS
jgi:hypothetical protein